MPRHVFAAIVLLTTWFGVASWGVCQDDDNKVYRNVTADKLESILKDLKITFQKIKGKDEGILFYDFERNNFKIRLHNYHGKDLWIDAHFTDKLKLDEINRWNIQAKFSRAVLLTGTDRSTVSVEASWTASAASPTRSFASSSLASMASCVTLSNT